MGMTSARLLRSLGQAASQTGPNADGHGDLFADQPAFTASQAVMLDGPADLDGFRRAARSLLARQLPPESVRWHCSSDAVQDLFAAESAPAEEPAGAAANAPAVTVPADFMRLCRSAILHSDAGRFGLLYRIFWRLVHEPGLRHDPLDADQVRARHMAQAVQRDMHKMKAFVRFRSVQDDAFRARPEGGPMHVAWFEPEHHIVQAVAPFFAKRFTQMRWAILTPECSVQWDGSRLHFGPAACKADAPPADAGEHLWLTYYQNTFNPARLKLRMMQKEMPRRYWKNLPEAVFISGLAAGAAARKEGMLAQLPVPPRRRIPVAAAAPEGRSQAGASTVFFLLQQPADAGIAPGVPNPAALPVVASLPTLQAVVDSCRNCPIGAGATRAVHGEGPLGARLMLVGEQPGDQEDLRGRPFVGPAGQLLGQAMHALGWQRDTLFLTNAVRHFKFEPVGRRRLHRTPSSREIAACRPWLESEISTVRPGAIVALGATAAASLLGRPVAVMADRGQWFQRPDGLWVLVTLHPAALLRAEPAGQADAYQAWLQDLQHADQPPG